MRAFRILTAIFAILAAVSAPAQSPPVTVNLTGNLGQIAGTPQPYGGLSIQLQNCPSPVAITGYSVIVQQAMQLRADASGVINASIWPNDEINCNGTTGQSMYAVVPVVNGVPSAALQCYQITAAQTIWNLNTQQPIACTQTPPNPQDATYNNLNVNGCLSIHGGACGGGTTAGVTKIIAGTNVSVSPSGGTGNVTINAAGGGGGGMVYPPAGVAQSTGVAWDVSMQVQGNDTKLLSAGVVSGTAIPLCTDALGGATTVGCPATGTLPGFSGGGNGIVYEYGAFGSPPSTRPATGSDLITLFGYSPLNPASNLLEVSSPAAALKNLFAGANLQSTQLVSIDAFGNPYSLTVGGGLTTQTSGSGSVAAVTAVQVGADFSVGTVPLTFTGGGGTGAAGYLVLTSGGRAPSSLQAIVITAGGSGYTTAPTVTSGSVTAWTLTAHVTTGTTISTTSISNVATLAAGTVTVNNGGACAVAAGCTYKLTHCAPNASTAIGTLSVGTVAPGVSFIINSLSATNTVATGDLSTVCWQIN